MKVYREENGVIVQVFNNCWYKSYSQIVADIVIIATFSIIVLLR